MSYERCWPSTMTSARSNHRLGAAAMGRRPQKDSHIVETSADGKIRCSACDRMAKSTYLGSAPSLPLRIAERLSALKLFCRFSGPKFTAEEETVRLSLWRDALVQFVACFDRTAPYHLRAEDIYHDGNKGLSYF